MALDGLFFRRAATLGARHHAPVFALAIQGAWAMLLTLSGSYSDLLDYVIFAVLVFYILTIAGIFVLRRTRPEWSGRTRPFGYPVLPATLHRGGGGDRNPAARLQAELHLAGADHRAAGRARVFYLEAEIPFVERSDMNLFATKPMKALLSEAQESGSA